MTHLDVEIWSVSLLVSYDTHLDVQDESVSLLAIYYMYLDVQDESISLHSVIAVDAGVLVEAKDVDVLWDERVSETVGQPA